MGLDITYYRGLVPAPNPTRDEYGDVDYQVYFTAHPDGLERRAPDLAPGSYTFAAQDGFRAGSYSGYNAWRNELAKFAGYPSAGHVWRHEQDLLGKPFVELISFSDCEGVIGPAVSAKLAKDFADFQERADLHALDNEEENEWWRELYARWRKAFEAAADGGAVDFH